MILLLLFSFLSGLITVLSPCILPVLPVLLSAGIGSGRYRPLGIIIGLVFSFAFFTLALTSLVHATGISPNILRYGAIGMIFLFGLIMLFPVLSDRFAVLTSSIGRLGTSVQEKSNLVGSGFLSGLLLGVALGLIWTPCAGPILASIVSLVATSAITFNAVVITLAYSLGAAIPMFLISYGGNKILHSTQFIAGYSEIIRKVFGFLMILSALALAFHFDVVLQQFALNYFPMLSVENNEIVRQELEKIQSLHNPNFVETSDGIKAPDFIGITEWINSHPLTLEELKGKVVLVDFWTYSCINCIRTLPYLKEWYTKYKDKGFVIVGVHTPEFEFEKDVKNVQDATKRFAITYPVAMDNYYKTWNNYNNHYWPAHYLIDQNGFVKEKHFGEGGYQETENAIRILLGLMPLQEKVEAKVIKTITPETYLGYERAGSYQPEITLNKDQTVLYSYKNILGDDKVGLKNLWLITPHYIQSKSDMSILELNFKARRVYLVMQSPTPQNISILLDNKLVPMKYHTSDMNQNSQIQVNTPRMYDIIDLKNDYGRHMLTLQVPQNVSLYAFTFGAEAE